MWSYKSCTYVSELEQNGGRVEVDKVGQKWSVEGGFPGGRTRGDKREEGKREVVP